MGEGLVWGFLCVLGGCCTLNYKGAICCCLTYAAERMLFIETELLSSKMLPPSSNISWPLQMKPPIFLCLFSGILMVVVFPLFIFK